MSLYERLVETFRAYLEQEGVEVTNRHGSRLEPETFALIALGVAVETEEADRADAHVITTHEPCRDEDCEYAWAHFDADQRWCEHHGWAIGNPCGVTTPDRSGEPNGG